MEGASTGDSEAPLSRGDTPGRGNTQKEKKKKRKKASQSGQRSTTPSGLQASPSNSAGLATQGSQHSTPILPSTPGGTRKAPFLVSEDGGSTSTELYVSEVSDLSSQEGVYQTRTTIITETKTPQTTRWVPKWKELQKSHKTLLGALVH